VRNCCYVAVCSAALGASAPTGGGEGRVHIVSAARLQLVIRDSGEATHTYCRRNCDKDNPKVLDGSVSDFRVDGRERFNDDVIKCSALPPTGMYLWGSF